MNRNIAATPKLGASRLTDFSESEADLSSDDPEQEGAARKGVDIIDSTNLVLPPNSTCGKMPKKGVGYSLGAWGWRTSSAFFGVGRYIAHLLPMTKIGRGHSHAQKGAAEPLGAKFVLLKNAQKGGGL